MAGLPPLSGDQVIQALRRDGWRRDRQRGSHVIPLKPGHSGSLSVPLHREITPGILRALIRSAGLTLAEFIELL